VSTFKRRVWHCTQCDHDAVAFAWDYDPKPICPEHHTPMEEDGGYHAAAPGVIQDSFTPHWCETLGHEPVWVESKSQLKREADKRNLVNVVRHDEAYYARQRRRHDEELRDTGRNCEY
jgi:hypothetical protein